MTSLIDNDIVLKVVCYGLVEEVLAPACEKVEQAGVLGTMRFVVSSRIRKLDIKRGKQEVVARLEAFLRRVEAVEPTEDEQRMAADFELAAQRAGVSLDAGESHLCSVAISRNIALLLTGDKRAIAGLEILLDHDERLSVLCGRICHLEKIILNALAVDGTGNLRNAICAEPVVDKTLTICFGCRSESEPATAECLNSYTKDLEDRAARILAISRPVT